MKNYDSAEFAILRIDRLKTKVKMIEELLAEPTLTSHDRDQQLRKSLRSSKLALKRWERLIEGDRK